MKDYNAAVVEQQAIGADVFLLKLHCPSVALEARPGQFVLLRVAEGSSSLLLRPLGICGTDEKQGTFDLLYRRVGFGTSQFSRWEPGQSLRLRGPVGHSFAPAKYAKRQAVVGTLGLAPLLLLRQKTGPFDKLLLGVPDGTWRPFAQWVQQQIPETELYCDTGEIGHKGYSIDGLKGQDLSHTSLVACGPNPMMKALFQVYGNHCDDIQVSLEKRMGCGMGGCFGCVVNVTTGRRRVCVDGPVWQAREVAWNELHL